MSAAPETTDSNYLSNPISLYKFTRGTMIYAYTSADRDITFQNLLYKAVPITDSGIMQSGEPAEDNVTVSAPWTNEVVLLFAGTPPSDEVFLTIMRSEYQDDSFYAAWTGSITEVKRPTPAEAAITCQTLAQSFQRNGATLTYSRTCPYYLYDAATCKVDPNNYKLVTAPVIVDSQTLTSDDFATLGDSYYTGGYIEWLVPGSTDTFERRAIQSHQSTSITLLGLNDGLPPGTSINAYPGCDRSVATCNGKFNNLTNSGACNKMPGFSPFDNVNVF
jgi:uncharacterized phage protein (TIGR02218 family)